MKHTVLVTGSSRGIGRAIAERFARDGHRVAIHCHVRRAEADALKAALQQEHLSVMAVQGDVSKEAEVARMLEEIRAYFGPVDVLVNNAGIALPQQLLTDCTVADWDRLFAVNVRGAFLCCRGVLPDMVRKKRGSIVNLSSMWGVTCGSCEAPYSASKAALIGLTKALAREVAPSGIRVNCVAPGLHRNGDERRADRRRTRGHPAGHPAAAAGHAGGRGRGHRVPRAGRGALPHRAGARLRRRLERLSSAPRHYSRLPEG